MKTNVFVRVVACIVLMTGVAACMRPGETPEQFQARMMAAGAVLNGMAAQMQAETDRRNAFVEAHRPAVTSCSPNGMSYNCITY